MPGPQPQSLLIETHPGLFLEDIAVVGSSIPLSTIEPHSNRTIVWRCTRVRQPALARQPGRPLLAVYSH